MKSTVLRLVFFLCFAFPGFVAGNEAVKENPGSILKDAIAEAFSVAVLQQGGQFGKIFIKAASTKVEGQEFADQELEDSVTDLKKRAKQFILVERESEADFLLTVVKRETKVGQPSLLSHRTPRNVNDLYVALSVKINGKWKPGVMLSSNGCCKFWTDAANKVLKEAEDWIKNNIKK